MKLLKDSIGNNIISMLKVNRIIFLLILIVGIIVVSGCNSTKKTEIPISNSDENNFVVYQSPYCGCCSIYVKYLKKESKLKVDVIEMNDISPIKEKYGVPNDLGSCHTVVIGDYFIEGHIPFEAIAKLMEEKPDIAGIAMPGMPSGSPGMPGSKKGSFVIYAVNEDGSYDEFMTI